MDEDTMKTFRECIDPFYTTPRAKMETSEPLTLFKEDRDIVRFLIAKEKRRREDCDKIYKECEECGEKEIFITDDLSFNQTAISTKEGIVVSKDYFESFCGNCAYEIDLKDEL